MTQKQSQRASAGFTLLEMLVALTCVALIGVVLAESFGLALKSWRRAEAAGRVGGDMEAAERVLRRLVTSAVPLPGDGVAGAGTPIRFDGRPHAVTFLAQAPPAFFDDDLLQYRVALTGPASNRTLSVDWHIIGAARNAAAQHGRSELLRDVQVFQLSYFGEASDGGDLTWTSAWSGRATLPRLIRFTLRHRDPTGFQERTLYIAPRIASLPKGRRQR